MAESRCMVNCAHPQQIYSETQHPESWKRIQEIEGDKPQRPDVPDRERVPPRFVKELQCPSEVNEGQPVHMECLIEPIDDPELTVYFFALILLIHSFKFLSEIFIHLHITCRWLGYSTMDHCRWVADLEQSTNSAMSLWRPSTSMQKILATILVRIFYYQYIYFYISFLLFFCNIRFDIKSSRTSDL